MATIDLKHATLVVRDGSTTGADAGGAGAINHSGGYATGTTTMAMDGLAVTLSPGQTFHVTGETGAPVHTIVSRTPSSGSTTSITFTPGLASDVLDNVVLTFAAFAGVPNTLEITIGTGNMSYTEARNIEYRLNRGVLDTIREGDEIPVDVSFNFEWEFLRSSSGEDVTPSEALKQVGAAEDWVSSAADPCEPYAVDLILTYVPPCGDVDNEVIVLQDFRWENLDHSLKDGQVSVKGKCNITQADVSRVPKTSSGIMPSNDRRIAKDKPGAAMARIQAAQVGRRSFAPVAPIAPPIVTKVPPVSSNVA